MNTVVLQTLHIKNLALVVELEVEFGPGLNTVTGETGAGKSLILGAVQLLLGERAGTSVIRRGEERCDVSAVFRVDALHPAVASSAAELLTAAGVPACEDGQLLTRRVVTAHGSRAYVNGSSVTVGLLRELGSLLVDVHGPHEHQSLLKPRCQLELLDDFAGLTTLRARCREAYDSCHALRDALTETHNATMSREDRDLLEHQLREIDAAELDPDEEAQLEAQHRVADNAQRLIQIAGECSRGLTEADDCAVDQLGHLVRLIQELEQTDTERGPTFAEQIHQAVAMLQELSNDLLEYADSFDLDEEAFRRISDRMDTISRLKRKYGPTLEDVLAQGENMRERLRQATGREARLAELRDQLATSRERHRERCTALSAGRVQAAGALAEAIAAKLRKLGFENASFEIQVAEAEPGPTGHDRVEFCFAPNVGEEMLPLRQIASSGEMSRVMLAIKTVLTQADRVPVLIFDEVDANIGGRVAVTVAEELVAIGRGHQVLSITHLPQIAAAGASHFRVSKQVAQQRTTTTMERLESTDRESEIIRMLGSADDSAAAARHAHEMLVAAGQTAGSMESE